MKKLFLLWAALCLAATAWAQSAGKVRYQGEVVAGFGMGSGDGETDWIELQTVHGIRIGPALFCGAGIGVSHFIKYQDTYLPLFAQVKAYVGRRNTKPFFAVDGGYAFFLGPIGDGCGGGLSQGYGLLCPSWGVNCGINDRLAVNFSAGYRLYLRRGRTDEIERGIVFQAGLQF